MSTLNPNKQFGTEDGCSCLALLVLFGVMALMAIMMLASMAPN